MDRLQRGTIIDKRGIYFSNTTQRLQKSIGGLMQTAELFFRNIESTRIAGSSCRAPVKIKICDALKSETQSHHVRLEQRLNLFQRVISLHDYRELLSRLYGIYAPLEPVLWRSLEPLKQPLRLAERKKAPLLSRDLTACGLTNADIIALPRWAEIAPFPSVPQALGQLYVLEGATLGGQVITRHLRKMLPLKKTAGLSFFYSYGNEVSERWRQYREVMTRQITTAAQQELAVTAAVETFEAFERWMNRESATQTTAVEMLSTG
jgi:heme oxygenase (biliverdin-IX-beta and delta-forming)